MTTENLALMRAIGVKMDYITQRQRVLSQNIANSDTPNYRAHDLKPLKFKEYINGPKEQSVEVNRTNSRHIFVGDTSPYNAVIDRNVSEMTPTGNAVVLEEEMMKVAETQIQYELTTSLYKKNLGLIKTALGRR